MVLQVIKIHFTTTLAGLESLEASLKPSHSSVQPAERPAPSSFSLSAPGETDRHRGKAKLQKTITKVVLWKKTFNLFALLLVTKILPK
jgi:hypothetical protein